jgi:acyl carrier protein
LKSIDGDFIPYTIGTVSLTIDGNTVFVDTDSNGTWSIPLTKQIPNNILLKFWHGETNQKFTEIPITGLRIFFRKHFVVNYDPDSIPKFQLTDFREGDDSLRTVSKLLHSIHSKLAIVSTVFAQDNIERHILRVISETLPINITSITRSSHLIKTFHLDDRDQIRLKSALEREFKIYITAREWKNNLFVEDLINVIKRKLN